jgi:hypothetical protein
MLKPVMLAFGPPWAARSNLQGDKQRLVPFVERRLLSNCTGIVPCSEHFGGN